jgi:hypothetical protein
VLGRSLVSSPFLGTSGPLTPADVAEPAVAAPMGALGGRLLRRRSDSKLEPGSAADAIVSRTTAGARTQPREVALVPLLEYA